LLDRLGRINTTAATKTLGTEAALWRGNLLEADMDRLLVDLDFRSGQYRAGFETAKQTLASFPSSPAMTALSHKAQGQFERLYLDGEADRLQPVDALALFYDFRMLTPAGARGDQMIRNLASRLVKLDLLPQAAELLKYQIDNRLDGAAKAEVATQLGLVYIADRKPQEALKVLSDNQLTGVSPSLDRRRRLLEARALVDSARTDLALDLLNGMDGRDADLLRADALWGKKDYPAVGKLIEGMFASDVANASGDLSPVARTELVKAAAAYGLAGDKVGLARLRARYADAMAKAPEWPVFDYVTSTIDATSSPEFAQVVRSIAATDSLDAFLKSYKATYASAAAVAPDKASVTGDVAANAPAPAASLPVSTPQG
jgi:hypothetical protein